MDYPCAKFGDSSFSRFGFIVRTDRQSETDRQTDRQTDRHTDTHTENQRITDAAKRLTHATVVCVSNEGGNRLCSKKQLI